MYFAISSLAWAGIRPPQSEQSPARTIPGRQFFNTHGQPLKLKAVTSTIELPRPNTNTLLQRTSPGQRMRRHCSARDEVSLVWLHHSNLFLPASIRMWVSLVH